MDTEKIVINPTGEKLILEIREGQAPKILDPKEPIKIGLSGTLEAPLEFLRKRIKTDQIDQNRCHILVNRETLSIKLITSENDAYLTGSISGVLEFNSKFKEFGINTGKSWPPTDFGKFIKMNRSFFPDKQVAMSLTTELMNFKATVDNKIERSMNEKGDKSDNFSQVVNSNLPASFKVKLQIFKGSAHEEIEVETFADIDGRDVSFTLISPGANESLENIRDTSIDNILNQIKEIAPDIAIIEQ